MKKIRIFPIIISVVILLLLAFPGRTHGENAGPDDTLKVYVKQNATTETGKERMFIRGLPEHTIFVIKNNSDDFIMLRKFEVEGQLPDVKRWYGAVYGFASYSPAEDEWEYDELEQTITKPVFASGIIPPEGKLEIIRKTVFKNGGINVDVVYNKLTESKASRSLYFCRFSKTFTMKRRFERVKENDMKKLLDSRNEVDWTLVIFPKSGYLTAYKQRYTCRIMLIEPEFTLKEALTKIKKKAFDFVYWRENKGWVIKTEKGVYLVEKRRIKKLPDMDLRIFELMDASGGMRCILPLRGYRRFKPAPPGISGPGYFNPGITNISKKDIMSLFNLARARKDKISTLQYDTTGLGKKNYVVVGKADMNERKKNAAQNGS